MAYYARSRSASRRGTTGAGVGKQTSAGVDFLYKQRGVGAVLSTILIIIFALACLCTFLSGARKEWMSARLISAIVAVVSFLLALLLAHK